MRLEEQEAQEVYELDNSIRLNEQARRLLMVKNMEALIKMRDGHRYRIMLGDEKAPWTAYLAQVGIFYSRSMVRRWKRILDFLKEAGVETEVIFEVPESRLEQIALLKSAFKDKEAVLEILEDAKVLLARDWKDRILELRGQPTSLDCKHHFKLYQICPDCGEKHVKE